MVDTVVERDTVGRPIKSSILTFLVNIMPVVEATAAAASTRIVEHILGTCAATPAL